MSDSFTDVTNQQEFKGHVYSFGGRLVQHLSWTLVAPQSATECVPTIALNEVAPKGEAKHELLSNKRASDMFS
jgi:hypothetical protein